MFILRNQVLIFLGKLVKAEVNLFYLGNWGQTCIREKLLETKCSMGFGQCLSPPQGCEGC